jgi:hypothetical protein
MTWREAVSLAVIQSIPGSQGSLWSSSHAGYLLILWWGVSSAS